MAKTVTWRFVGTLDTIVVSWILTGNPYTGFKIGAVEVITKMALYYLHERIWFNIGVKDSKKRHLIKTMTWRVIGTTDTILLSWFITGSSEIGIQIGITETITKMFLYYLHERAWYQINFGLDRRQKS
ncbi:DUF2061 domain-containing protein [Ulvibacterium marinum]|uniref:DUF2061 domain-containing protein n=1 Tax=Ulvibacterium marinum TaxID=2419782 RepID=UPI0024953114|nr:DUF2061 domain-containing protein [Ulvibacterium marinum]